MAIVKNVELWWVKCDPKNPVKNADPSKPSTWEVQLRTTDKKFALEWAKNNIKFKPLKRKILDEDGQPKTDELGEEIKEIVLNDAGKPYFAVNLRRKNRKANGEPMLPVKVVTGSLEELDPKSIGNGSIANVGVFQYDYTFEGKDGVANMLKSIQVTKLMEYKSKGSDDDFDMVDMEIVKAKDSNDSDNSDLDDEIPF
jgi:hypothetical protein